MERNRTWMGHLAALATILIWGSTFVSSKVLLNSGLDPADIFFYRFLMAYICMLFFCHGQGYCGNKKDEIRFVGLGLTGGSLYFLVENMALKYSITANVGIIVCSCPLITALVLGIAYKDERLNLRQAICMFVAFLGVILTVLNGQINLHLNPLGDSLALGAAIIWTLYSLLIKGVLGRYSTEFITRKVFFYGLLTIIPYYLYKPLCTDTAILFRAEVWANLLFLGFLASMGAFLLWNWVLGELGAVKATNYLYFQCLITLFMGHFVLGETITSMAIAGAVVLIGGMMGVFLGKKSKSKK